MDNEKWIAKVGDGFYSETLGGKPMVTNMLPKIFNTSTEASKFGIATSVKAKSKKCNFHLFSKLTIQEKE